MTYPGRWLGRMLAGVTVLSGVLVIGWWVSAAWVGDVACEFTPHSSNYGEATISWLPPGRTCTYANVVPGTVHVDTPDWSRLLVLATAVGGLPLTRFAQRVLARTSENPSA